MSDAKLASESNIARGFFNGVEVSSLEVLNEGEFEDFAVIGWALDDGYFLEFKLLGGSPAAFSSDELKLSIDRAYDERLDHAMVADRFHEFVELAFEEVKTWLQGGGTDLLDGNFADSGASICGCGGARIGEIFRLPTFLGA